MPVPVEAEDHTGQVRVLYQGVKPLDGSRARRLLRLSLGLLGLAIYSFVWYAAAGWQIGLIAAAAHVLLAIGLGLWVWQRREALTPQSSGGIRQLPPRDPWAALRAYKRTNRTATIRRP